MEDKKKIKLIKFSHDEKKADVKISLDGKIYEGQLIHFTGKPCKYCGEDNESPDENLLCSDCRETFGHSLFSEL